MEQSENKAMMKHSAEKETAFHQLSDAAIMERMLRVRYEHAKNQKKDYSHLFRSKSRWDFVRLSFVIMGIEFVYSAETAFVSPILLGIGVEHQLMTLVWAISPLVGFFVAPILGTISDRCVSKLGRRRPVLLGLSFSMLLGCILVPYGENVGKLFGDLGEVFPEAPSNLSQIVNSNLSDFTPYKFNRIEEEIGSHEMNYKWAIFFTILGVLLLDFSADTSHMPARAYLLDVCLPEEHGRACSTFSILAGIGGCLGYALGGFNWDNTSFGEFLGGSIKTVFTIVGFIFLVCLILTATSFREVPLPVMEKDDLLKPLTEVTIKKERAKIINSLKTIDEKGQPAPQMITNALTEIEKEAEKPMIDDSISEDEDNSMTLRDFLKSIILMPKSIAILCLTNLLCWMGHLSFCLYFTDFVGEEVFKGNPAAPSISEDYQLYLEGVRYGCYGLAIYSLACSCYSFTIEKLIKVLRARIVYGGGLLLDSMGMMLMAVFPNKVTVFVFSATGGIVYALLFTMPFLLLGQYHAKERFKANKSGKPQEPERKRGLATDIAMVGGMIFVAQIIVSLGLGSFISWLGSTTAVIYAAGICSFLAAISSTQVVYMDL
ncbi:proton-associated sugar transporter A-like [Topomyia yanbarensis]|uniref:proton-associated sugar transporter A-like n=1 Tax=Topomyia yanbarensis TaxID=2498891 RepID=UPI00273B13C1|nr:proton-associated sugar transporter A-like [Topomyia yanbarensis]XP_058832813.1 proton-associated sugar transporter A-like [Topomyia yanbarensis]XP_058832814.1 proton-associated sugar transporter A-like [Topomyia yanbarensis]XP_058832815.1 proton-associated sugar transporter A-like [Topomyia yanbarensis]XP_058832817.1 proton-associated sugar transporter A-like [Topomyia yanbarensis]XP_058832818.1 proton-associated sugar transporter A-like [Topomyia yanbarensis]XP_058832819.1 proton-associa